MLSLPTSVKVFVAAEPVDGRKGFNGLLAIVRGQWQRDVFSGHLFVFLSRRRKLVKVLAWSRGGFVLHIKRLEQGRFVLPVCNANAAAVEMDATALAMLLDGIDLSTVQRGRAWEPGRPSII
jgi:transposase